jgi:hypothetical protein
MRWLGNHAIQMALVNQCRDREVQMVQFARTGRKPFWIRRIHLNSSKSVDYWFKSLHWPYEAVGTFIGTNRIDWSKVGQLPPTLRSKGITRKDYKLIWDKYLTPAGCKELGLTWSEIWYGKSLLFDFDDILEPMQAFDKAEKTAQFLQDNFKVVPRMVFSGSKGFHIHLDLEDSYKCGGKKPIDFIDQADPLLKLGRHNGALVQEIASIACGERYPIADRSSNFRQGVVRCPYSIHPKTGQVVWPLNSRDLKKIRALSADATILDIAAALHTWDVPVQSHLATSEVTYIHPENSVFERGLPAWESSLITI